MHKRIIFSYVLYINFFVAIGMVPSILVAGFNHENCFLPFLESFLIVVVPCGLFGLVFRPRKAELSAKDGWCIASFAWLLAGLFGALPYLLSHVFGPFSLENFVNYYFESISGFTTTGSSVFGSKVPIESLDHALLLWRSITHWLGGLGILILIVVVLPVHSSVSSILFRSETSFQGGQKIKPRTKEVARTLWLVYVSITAAGTVALMLGGLSLFEAFCNSVGAVATGGYSTRDASIEGFNSLYVEMVIVVLMIAGSTSFALHYRAITKGIGGYWDNSQFKWYLFFMVSGVIAITLILYFNKTYLSFADALRYGSFQSVSIMSTTGYATAPFGGWPYGTRMLLIIFMFMGSMVGSTSGAIKTSRVVVLIKFVYREMLKIIHPKIFATIKMDGKVMQKDDVEKVMGFFFLYILIFVLASVLVLSTGLDIITSISSVATTMGGVGPGFGLVNASSNFYAVPMFAKCILILCMLLGRLEIFAFLSLFTPLFWKK